MAAFLGCILHLGGGAAREERDNAFAEHGRTGSVPDKWASPGMQETISANDAVQMAQVPVQGGTGADSLNVCNHNYSVPNRR
jgi:hypothetical protein